MVLTAEFYCSFKFNYHLSNVSQFDVKKTNSNKKTFKYSALHFLSRGERTLLFWSFKIISPSSISSWCNKNRSILEHQSKTWLLLMLSTPLWLDQNGDICVKPKIFEINKLRFEKTCLCGFPKSEDIDQPVCLFSMKGIANMSSFKKQQCS